MNYDLDTKEGMANAIAWTNGMLSQLKDRGVWIVPRSGTVVHFNQQELTATVAGFLPDSALARVLTAMGYTVEEKLL